MMIKRAAFINEESVTGEPIRTKLRAACKQAAMDFREPGMGDLIYFAMVELWNDTLDWATEHDTTTIPR